MLMDKQSRNDELLKKLDERTVKSEHVLEVERAREREEKFKKNVDKATDEVDKFATKVKKFFSKKKNVIIVVFLILILAGGGAMAVFLMQNNSNIASDSENGKEKPKNEAIVKKFYDDLTGELLSYSGVQYNADGSEKKAEDGSTLVYSERQAEQQADNINLSRINCVQIPNGTDARPQVGLSEAKIVYEAIAEGGITRFAALYRGATSNVIGPVRSLRTYYLDWDIPYDCTIVHAGGEEVALQRVKDYSHLSESKEYMWRDYSGYRAPNNLFTSAELLNKFNKDKSYLESRPKVFARLTPDESNKQVKDIRQSKLEGKTQDDESAKYAYADSIYVHVTTNANYNVQYSYDASTNSYLRAYEGASGKHVAYTCKNLENSGNKIKPQKDCGAATQLAPKVVVVMKVEEKLNQSNLYREDITTTGNGEAWIFQNGIVIPGTWSRGTDEQLKFKDANGNEIKLAPGQTWITSVAKSYGYVKY